jgi:hypothetical protein
MRSSPTSLQTASASPHRRHNYSPRPASLHPAFKSSITTPSLAKFDFLFLDIIITTKGNYLLYAVDMLF